MSQYRRDMQLETFWGNIFSCDSPWWRLVMMISLYSYQGRKAFQTNVKISFPGKSNQFCNLFWANVWNFRRRVKKKKISMEFSKLVLKCACWGQRTCSPEGMYRFPFSPPDLAKFVTAEHGIWRSKMVSSVSWQLWCQNCIFLEKFSTKEIFSYMSCCSSNYITVLYIMGLYIIPCFFP